MVSLVNEPDRGEIVEVATIGCEAFTGFPILLGADTILSRTIVQVPGEALRLATATFRRFIEAYPGFHLLLMRATMALVNQIAQNASCNRLHPGVFRPRFGGRRNQNDKWTHRDKRA